MTTRERFQAVMNFQPFDRLPMVEWAVWWDKTLDRWYQEGLPVKITNRYDIYRHFGLELYQQVWISPRGPACPEPTAHGAGIISSAEDYEKMLKHLYPLPAIDREKWSLWAKQQERGEVVIWFTVEGFFWHPRVLFGIEPHFYAFYDQPELMHRMNSDLADWILAVIEEVCSICTPDFMTFAEDMSYNFGSMLSKNFFDEFLNPYYAKVVPELKARGIISFVDSDGDITIPATWFEGVGIEGMLPLERQAGVDINRLREQIPVMRFIGHFDKMTMNKGEKTMRQEFERLLPTAAKGGFIISCDHQTPPEVSYKDYRLYLSLFQEYAEKAGKMSQELLKE